MNMPESIRGAPVDGIEAASGGRGGCEEDGVRRDAVPVDGGGRLQVVHEEQAQLGDDIHQPILLADLHGHGEVIRKLLWEEQLRLLLQWCSACQYTVPCSQPVALANLHTLQAESHSFHLDNQCVTTRKRRWTVPGAAPNSMTCSFDVRTPFAKVFWAKLITVLDVWEPGACISKRISKRQQP